MNLVMRQYYESQLGQSRSESYNSNLFTPYFSPYMENLFARKIISSRLLHVQ